MGGSYKQCPECGRRALSIASRCPGCLREFPAPAVPEGGPALELSRFLSPRAAAGVLAVAAILTAAELGRTSPPSEEQSSLVATDSAAASSEVAYAMAAAARLDTARAGAVPARSAGELLVARTWTSVRKSRSKRADLEAVLLPGDTVLADSLRQGWYRVALEGEVLGYAHRSLLAPAGRREGGKAERRKGGKAERRKGGTRCVFEIPGFVKTGRAWAHDALELYRVSEAWPRAERYEVTSQVRRAAVSVPANIAEGVGKRGTGELRRYLDIALGSLSEISYLLLFARDRGLLQPEVWESLESQRNHVGRLTWGMARAVERAGGRKGGKAERR